MNEEQMDKVLFALYHAKINFEVTVETEKKSDNPALLKYYEKLLSEVREAHKIMQDFIHEQIVNGNMKWRKKE